MEKSILVAIDGSAYSSNSLDYLAGLFSADPQVHVHLLTVSVSGGGKDWMFDVDPYRTQAPGTEKHSRTANKYLKDAEHRLLSKGFAQERIHTLSKSSSSVSKAIREEAERGHYACLLVGRRGLGAMGNMLLGSISADLVRSCTKTPLWIIDGKVTHRSLLFAVQCHPASLMAADHVAFMLKERSDIDIYLYHSGSMFGGNQASPAEDFHQTWGKSWCDRNLDLKNHLIGAHAQVLVDNGVSRHRIQQIPERINLGAGSDLLRQAKAQNCGTIVIGHRTGHGSNRPLKGLSDKALKQAQGIAVWLIG